MNDLINQLIRARDQLIEVVKQFPKDKREAVLFDQWSLKEMIAHLSGWAEYQIKSLEQLQKFNQIPKTKNLKALINEDFVNQRRKSSWESVYQEYVKDSNDLIRHYQKLSKRFWNQTTKDLIQIEIKHYIQTHGPQIKKVIKQLSVK